MTAEHPLDLRHNWQRYVAGSVAVVAGLGLASLVAIDSSLDTPVALAVIAVGVVLMFVGFELLRVRAIDQSEPRIPWRSIVASGIGVAVASVVPRLLEHYLAPDVRAMVGGLAAALFVIAVLFAVRSRIGQGIREIWSERS